MAGGSAENYGAASLSCDCSKLFLCLAVEDFGLSFGNGYVWCVSARYVFKVVVAQVLNLFLVTWLIAHCFYSKSSYF
jgi:uncharacterized membrane protein